MDLKRVLSTDNSRIRAIFLLKIESLIIFAIVIYLIMVAPDKIDMICLWVPINFLALRKTARGL
jgi:hypothetical protein